MSNEIEKLFHQWYEAQCLNENQQSSGFIYDGSLSDRELTQHDVLFVCRESNDLPNELKEDFWFKNVVYGSENNGAKYYNCVNLIIDHMNNSIISESDLIKIKNCAYMNINKKGGRPPCDFYRLNEYAKKYKNFIIKEIEILDPKNIVILGKLNKAKDAEGIFIEYGQKHNIKVFIYDRHPSIYSKDIPKHFYLVNTAQ